MRGDALTTDFSASISLRNAIFWSSARWLVLSDLRSVCMKRLLMRGVPEGCPDTGEHARSPQGRPAFEEIVLVV
jgi:hypothetical protein